MQSSDVAKISQSVQAKILATARRLSASLEPAAEPNTELDVPELDSAFVDCSLAALTAQAYLNTLHTQEEFWRLVQQFSGFLMTEPERILAKANDNMLPGALAERQEIQDLIAVGISWMTATCAASRGFRAGTKAEYAAVSDSVYASIVDVSQQIRSQLAEDSTEVAPAASKMRQLLEEMEQSSQVREGIHDVVFAQARNSGDPMDFPVKEVRFLAMQPEVADALMNALYFVVKTSQAENI